MCTCTLAQPLCFAYCNTATNARAECLKQKVCRSLADDTGHWLKSKQESYGGMLVKSHEIMMNTSEPERRSRIWIWIQRHRNIMKCCMAKIFKHKLRHSVSTYCSKSLQILKPAVHAFQNQVPLQYGAFGWHMKSLLIRRPDIEFRTPPKHFLRIVTWHASIELPHWVVLHGLRNESRKQCALILKC